MADNINIPPRPSRKAVPSVENADQAAPAAHCDAAEVLLALLYRNQMDTNELTNKIRHDNTNEALQAKRWHLKQDRGLIEKLMARQLIQTAGPALALLDAAELLAESASCAATDMERATRIEEMMRCFAAVREYLQTVVDPAA